MFSSNTPIKLGKIVVIFVLLITCWQAAKILLVAFFSLKAEQEFGSALHDAASRARVSSYLSQAQQFDPKDPDIQLSLGRLQMMNPVRLENANLGAALIHYRNASALQPHRALAWANIFVVKTGLKTFDLERQEALEKAALYGGWDPEVQYLIVDAGTRAWLQATRHDRVQIIDMATRGLVTRSRYRRAQLENLLRTRGFEALVCGELIHQAKESAFCPDL